MYSPRDFSYYIVSLGCSKNQTESEKIKGMLESIGMPAAQSAEEAALIVVNTCGFIESAKQESIDVIFEALDLKRTIKKPKIIVVGCLTKRYFKEIKDEISEIDFIYGLIDEKFSSELTKFLNIKLPVQISGNTRIPLFQNLAYEYIKISDGCSNNCSYCAIPLIRGAARSFPRAAVITDAKKAAARGAKELIVIAQDIAAYNDSGYLLADLLHDLSKIEGPEWIRLLYCHPDHLSAEIIEEIKNNSKIVPYIDVPFQHANKEILHSMNRAGSYQTYLDLINKLRKEVADIVIRSTFLVGYPGETDAQFAELLQFLKEANLDRVGCFIYSQEEDTRAAQLKDLEPEIKQQRYDSLMQLQKNISIKKMRAFIGKRVRVLIEEQVDEFNWIGRTEYDAPEVDGIFYLTAKEVAVKNIVSVKVTEALEYDLAGTL